MNLFYGLALFFFYWSILSERRPPKGKKPDPPCFRTSVRKANDKAPGIIRRSGSYGDNGDDKESDMKPPFRFPFGINGPKYLVLHSVFWAAQNEIAEFASQLRLFPGDYKELEENAIVLDDFAFRGQLINEVNCVHCFFFTLTFKFAMLQYKTSLLVKLMLWNR